MQGRRWHGNKRGFSRGVQALLSEQLFVCAELLHAPVVEHGNLVGVADRSKAVRNRERGALLLGLKLVQGRLNLKGQMLLKMKPSTMISEDTTSRQKRRISGSFQAI